MRSPTLLLFVLAFAASLAVVYTDHPNDNVAYLESVKRNQLHELINSGRFNGHLAHIDAPQTTYRRCKRATKAFLQAWKQLLKTTVGFSRYYTDVPGKGHVQGKIFFKVGSMDNAVQDFYSLGPKHVAQTPDAMKGVVGKQVVVLRTDLSGKRLPVMAVNDGRKTALRSIYYVNTPAHAQAKLGELRKAFHGE